MERKIEVRHVTVEVETDFENFTHNFERALGRFDPAMIQDLATAPAEAQKRLEKMAGEEGLMLFNIQDHGTLLNILGSPKKAKQYVLGNPLIAMTMTRHDIRAALYAPLRVLVYEAEDHSTRVEFDQPSSLFGQFEHPEVTSVGLSLDKKLANLIKKAEEGARGAGKGAVAG
jgi:uncharacterized protein (DUF302 family)